MFLWYLCSSWMEGVVDLLANNGKPFVGGISSILVIITSNCSIGLGKFEQIVGDLDPARYRTGHIPRR